MTWWIAGAPWTPQSFLMAAIDTPWIVQMATPKSQRRDTQDAASSAAQFLAPTATPSRHPTSSDGFTAAFSAPGPNPTYAAFSPATLSGSTTSAAKRRSTILVHQKSPLLLATPPQITRALAYSHPFLLPLNKLVGLLTWTTEDQWESFLLVVAFWATVLYGDVLVRVVGPLLLVGGLIAGMYGRRFSPLSSSSWTEPASKDGAVGNADQIVKAKRAAKPAATSNGSATTSGGAGGGATKVDGTSTSGGTVAGGGGGAGQGHQRAGSTAEATSTRHRKTLDEMVETLREFTSRCNILLEPLLELTDFLSTQRTPTSATTRPALTALLIRILLCTPFWFALTLPPWRLITARRVVLVAGTVALTWHARVCCVGRTLLWRSRSVRRLAALVTGLEFEGLERLPPSGDGGRDLFAASAMGPAATQGHIHRRRESELTKAIRRAARGGGGNETGVRFTFIIYENQRRWVGLGWTSSLFTYERAAWTDERNNPVPPRDQFELPEVEDGSRMRWRWVQSSRWKVDGVPDDAVRAASKQGGGGDGEWNYDGEGGKMGWVYYDNKWQNGRRGQDSWGRWTRRRKWYRDAELVEMDDIDIPPSELPGDSAAPSQQSPAVEGAKGAAEAAGKASGKHGGGGGEDASSVLSSSSSRSAAPQAATTTGGGWASGFRAPSLRRRATDTSTTRRGRRTSSAAASSLEEEREDAAASLGTSLGLEIQGASMERDQWGVGDELRMGLE
ncbi:hypothetical protein RB596_003817 [Gaeumannomyces avenae]